MNTKVVLQPPSRGSSAQPVTRVQRFAATILQYIRDNLKAGKTETFESVIRSTPGLEATVALGPTT